MTDRTAASHPTPDYSSIVKLLAEIEEPRLGIHEDGTEELKSWDHLWNNLQEAAKAIRALSTVSESTPTFHERMRALPPEDTKACDACQGSGEGGHASHCATCGGTGTVAISPSSAGMACSKCGKTPPFPGGTRCQDLQCPLVNWAVGPTLTQRLRALYLCTENVADAETLKEAIAALVAPSARTATSELVVKRCPWCSPERTCWHAQGEPCQYVGTPDRRNRG